MQAKLGCIFTKALIPFVEREVGSEGAAAIVRAAGRPRDWLIAEYNSLPLSAANDLVRLSMELMGEPDEERWARRYAENFMDWKPSREERAWGGAYTMSFGTPRALFAKIGVTHFEMGNFWTIERLDLRRNRAAFRLTPAAGVDFPRWVCTLLRVSHERFPTNWNLPRAVVTERQCAARGASSCIWDVGWKNPSFGARFWLPALTGATSAMVAGTMSVAAALPTMASAALVVLPAALGSAVGAALLKDARHRKSEKLLEVQRAEILYSSGELEKKFRDLEGKIEQLSLLIDLSRAVNATLDPELIYEHAVGQLVDRMGYPSAHLYLVDERRRTVRGHKAAGRASEHVKDVELPLDADASAVARVATTGLPVRVDDVEASPTPVHLATVRALDVRSFVAVPLRVKDRTPGVLTVSSTRPNGFAATDVELLSAVANHVALAVERAETFQTIEELSRGLEEKVRVRTEQLRGANEELQAAYRNLQHTQMQLIQREKMASVGQLVAGVAHELNNPIGFVYSNVTTLEDFVRRLRTMLDAYRATPLAETERAALETRWGELKVDYALRYLDTMTQGIREGAERARKIVRDLRVFARSDSDAWQPVDLRDEIESSLTLLNHLLKDRVTVHRKFGTLQSVECVRSQIDQVFLNVLANAAQAISGSGELTIETRREDGFAAITIADTGPGIAADIIGRIFDPFFTTKPVGEGTGLGLSISYEIVKKHGGDITVESRPGEGAAFTIRLPAERAR